VIDFNFSFICSLFNPVNLIDLTVFASTQDYIEIQEIEWSVIPTQENFKIQKFNRKW
jgi:hypothetical protein